MYLVSPSNSLSPKWPLFLHLHAFPCLVQPALPLPLWEAPLKFVRDLLVPFATASLELSVVVGTVRWPFFPFLKLSYTVLFSCSDFPVPFSPSSNRALQCFRGQGGREGLAPAGQWSGAGQAAHGWRARRLRLGRYPSVRTGAVHLPKSQNPSSKRSALGCLPVV